MNLAEKNMDLRLLWWNGIKRDRGTINHEKRKSWDYNDSYIEPEYRDAL